MQLSDFNLHEVGTKIGLVGAVFGDDDKLYLCMFPDQPVHDQEVLVMDLEDWKTFMKQVDFQEVEVLQKTADGKLAKGILRKSQRLIEQRVSWKVFQRDDYSCRYCGADGVPLTVDHLVLWEEGGPSVEANLVASCRKCNKTRGNMQLADWFNHPYYKKVSAGLPMGGHEMNRALLPTLDGIERRYTERKTRK